MSNIPEITDDAASPSCVAQVFQQQRKEHSKSLTVIHHGPKGGLPGRLLRKKRRVSFSVESPKIHLSQTTKEEIRVPCWFSGDDMYDFKNDARRTVKEFRKANHDFLNDFSVLLEACSPKEKNPIQGIAKSVACQNVLFRTTTPSYSVRGLEGYLHPMVRQHRNDHVKTFLATQAVLSFGDEGSSKENKLRFLSMHTSRRSRVLARLLAHAHALQLANNPQGEDL
jgi:hypothetical protein